MRILADLLRRDSFPASETLDFYKCVDVGDEGAVALAEALQDAKRTFLRDLELRGVGMSDAGIAHWHPLFAKGAWGYSLVYACRVMML